MIVSESGAFLIATPTKCATTTLEAVTRRHMRHHGPGEFDLMEWDSPRRQHRMALPPDVEDANGRKWKYGDFDRFLFVRNPYRRYMSVYTYLSAPANYSQWGAREVQGVEWGGHDERKIVRRPKMSFETFLFWLADRRADDDSKRGSYVLGKAYRSPWVWTDSLTMSLDFLIQQPGDPNINAGLLRMESIWAELERLSDEYDLDLNLSPIHANRSTAYGESGALPGGKEFWGGIKCGRRVFRGRIFLGDMVQPTDPDCRCAACAIGVADEAITLGYYGP